MISEHRSDILGPVDSAFYYTDSPRTPMNLGAVTIFEGFIPYDKFFQFIDSRIYQAPIYLKRIVQAPFSLSEPRWILDPDFHTSQHVFHHDLDAPGTDEQLRELAGYLVSGMLDHNKPLWQIYLITGLERNRSAVLFKVHHCMVDGLSAVELFTLLLDLTPDTNPSSPQKIFYVPPPVPTTLELLAGSASKEISHKVSMLQRLGKQALQLGAILADQEERRKMFVGVANLINDNLTPIKKLLINGTNTGRLTLAWTDYSLSEIREIHSTQHASINEVMLAILGMGLGIYLQKRGETANQDVVRVLAPVNVRKEEDKGALGNRIAVLPIDVPLYLADPLECLQKVVEHSQTMKQSQLAQSVDMVLTLPSLALSVAQPVIWGAAPRIFALLAHTWCTNVAGPEMPIYLMGHKMTASFGYFPLNPSMGLACVIMSYNYRISMTLIADGGIVPDVLELRRCLDRAYIALREAAHVSGAEPLVIEPPTVVSQPIPAEPSAPVPVTASGTIEDQGKSGPLAMEQSEVSYSPNPMPEYTSEQDIPDAPVNPAAPAEDSTKPDPLPVGWPEAPYMPRPIPEDPPEQSVAEKPVGSTVPVEDKMDTAQVTSGADHPKTGGLRIEPIQPGRVKIFSEAWAAAYQTSINCSTAYHDASTRWTAGPLAFIMRACPEHGFLEDSAVLLDLHQGYCRSACALPPQEAKMRAKFVLEGEYDNWIKVLTGQAQPIPMILRNKLALTKGSMFSLMPFTQSAQELVHCAEPISET